MPLKNLRRSKSTVARETPNKPRPILKTYSQEDIRAPSFRRRRRRSSSRHLNGGGGTYQRYSALRESIASFVDVERMPFLVRRLGLLTDDDHHQELSSHDDDDDDDATLKVLTSHLWDLADIKINTGKGGILGEGDFTRTHEIKSFRTPKGKSGSSRHLPNTISNAYEKTNIDINNAPQYAIKCLNPRILGSDRSVAHESSSVQVDAAVHRLIREALYLSQLSSHPFILPFRGWCFHAIALQQVSTALDGIALITDRLGDTLEMRMKLWKQLRAKRGGHKEALRQKENFILGSLQMDLAMIGHDLMHKVPKPIKLEKPNIIRRSMDSMC